MKPLHQTWDLESLFPGGSHSTKFVQYIAAIKKDLEQLLPNIQTAPIPLSLQDLPAFSRMIGQLQELSVRIKQAGAFTACLTAQDMNDKQAVQLSAQVKGISASFSSCFAYLDHLLIQINDKLWEEMLTDQELVAISFPLTERRLQAKEKLHPEQEALIQALAVDGYHAWGEMYNTTVGQMQIPFEEKGQISQLSMGQAANKLNDSDRSTRTRLFSQWEETWSKHAEYCADALNHLAGFRLQVYQKRAWETILKEPLEMNRMTGATLDKMWQVIDHNKTKLLHYFKRKAELLHLPGLSWHDIDAPIGKTTTALSFDQAAQFIVEQFEKFSPKMAQFATHAFEKRWIEAEDRAGKRPGGFCTSLPDSQETRIFMTFSGSPSNVSTLAHELGHAYHQHVMNDLPPFTQRYAMNVAETASTFAELIVSDAAVKYAPTKEEKISLLEDKIQRMVAFFMNIHARFLFETRFYEERKEGLVSVQRLNQLMETAQREAYKEALVEYHPHFWASKLHFYLTSVPFYNFPYTFGFLFSAGIYQKALEEGSEFEQKYIDLLRDTGRMSVEDLALKHLQVDLQSEQFWQKAVDVALADIDLFLQLTEQPIN